MSYEQIAAIDMGSNSFRLEVGRVIDDQIYPLDTLKEMIRLASGLDAQNNLDEDSQQRALETLRRFGERLRGFQPDAVRAVATNTLRVAKNTADFLPRAEEALGFPIEVIRGREEARLIYIGVAHSQPPIAEKRLVIDIGGGSTECIIGQGIDPLLMESLYMGCVSYSKRFFPDGKITQKTFEKAELSAAREIESIIKDYRKMGWTEVVASSGTAKAITDLLDVNHMNPEGVTGISLAGMTALRDQLIKAGNISKLKLANLSDERRPVFAGGVAIMSAIFSTFGIEQISYGEGALRLGVLYDLLGRYHHRDMRDVCVKQFMQRYQVDIEQAERVKQTALELFKQIVPPESASYENEVKFLGWAASLHEVGISIAQIGFHKHGAYILDNADMPGFSKMDQEHLALIVLGQRGKLERFTTATMTESLWRLIFCLRMAILFHRSRDDQPPPNFVLKQSKSNGFQLELPSDWLNTSPLSAAKLEDEKLLWKNIGMRLDIRRKNVSS